MGYTHYWYIDHEDPAWPETFGRTALDAKRIIEAVDVMGIELVREYDDKATSPEISEGGIYFNGPDDLGHETFAIEAKPWWQSIDPADFGAEIPERPGSPYVGQRHHPDDGDNPGVVWRMYHYEKADYERTGKHFTCCKTARKPYDLAVSAILLRLAFHGGGVRGISSDGGWDEEWANGPGNYYGQEDVGARGFVATLFPDDPVVDLPAVFGWNRVEA